MIYQFKIQVEGFENPEVWRQVTVPSDYSFAQFQKVITIVFGKEPTKSLFNFSISKRNYTIEITSFNIHVNRNIRAKTTLLSSIFQHQGQTCDYYPDFDKKWLHHIVLEKILYTKISHPDCLAGEGAYPPETCINIEDYKEMMMVLSDKNHPHYKSTCEWLELDENQTWESKHNFNLSEIKEQLMNIDTPLKLFHKGTVVEGDICETEGGDIPDFNFESVKVISEKVKSANKAPDFENQEVKILYETHANIELEVLYRIIELPRESLIRDMEKILIDSVARYKHFKDSMIDSNIQDAPIHALNILAVLKAEEALDTLFTVLRQDSDYYDFWYGDLLTEDFWRFIYMMGQNSLDRLKDFVLEPNRYVFARSAVCQAVMQLALNQKERKEEVVKWFVDVLQYLLDNATDANVFDCEAYSHWYGDLLVVAERQHFPMILRVYNENLLHDNFSLHKIKKTLVRDISQNKVEIYTTIDEYYKEWNKYYTNNTFNNYSTLPKHFIATPKIGRNDPCTCGSGKKYKKCCGVNN